MASIVKDKITSALFQKDIRNEDFDKDFEKVFEIEIIDLLSEYDYEEIDEFPIEIENKGIMIGFAAETIKVPPQIEYIDLDIYNYPQNLSYPAKAIPHNFDILRPEDIEKTLSPCTNLRIYYSLYNAKQIDRIIFRHDDLRYELSINEDLTISRIRICFNENESNINMRTYYPFDN